MMIHDDSCHRHIQEKSVTKTAKQKQRKSFVLHTYNTQKMIIFFYYYRLVWCGGKFFNDKNMKSFCFPPEQQFKPYAHQENKPELNHDAGD